MNSESIITDIFSFYKELNIRVHLYLLRAEKIALIDSGTRHSPQTDILPVLRQSGLNLKDVDYILNTHGHIDHIGGNAVIKNAGKAKIFIHSDEADAVEDHTYFFKHFFQPMAEGIWGKTYVEKEWKTYSSLSGGEVTVDQRLYDGEVIDLGKGCSLRCIYIPGHTLGSVGFYLENEGTIFTGDSLPGLHEDNGDLPILTDPETYLKSIKRLLELPVRTIMQSHDHRGIDTPPSHVKKGAEVKQYLLDSYEAAERINEAIETTLPGSAGKSIRQVYNEVVAKLPANYKFRPVGDSGMLPLFSSFAIYYSLKAYNDKRRK